MSHTTWTQPAFEAVAGLLTTETGLVFAASRRADAEAGFRRAMAKAGVEEAGAYLERLRAGEAALDDLVAEVTVGETYFFRDPAQFAWVREEVLPDLLRRRGPAHLPRALSAGCASGEEAYSLAILFEEVGLGGRAHLLGVDISRPALARARQGSYGRWSLRGLDEERLRRCFCAAGERWILVETLRRQVAFEYLNLATDAYPSFATGLRDMDLVLCRNVLIYFDLATVRQVAARLHRTLAEGGWLVTGPADPPLGDLAPFETVVTPAGLFYRRRSGESLALGMRRSPAPAVAAAGERPPADVPGEPRARPVPVPPPPPPPDPVETARKALAAGDYEAALECARRCEGAAAHALRVRALANRRGSGAALAAAEEAIRRHPLAAELHFLHAVLMVDVGRLDEALRALRRALYLDRSLAVAHLALGSLRRRRGDLDGARRAYRTAAGLASARPPEEPVPLADGERAGRLARAAEVQAALLQDAKEAER